MGVDAGDVNNDGRPDFVISNFNDQYHSLFVATKSLRYDDDTLSSRLARYTKPFVGWGVHYIDFDNDGNLDLLIVNGHINQGIEATRRDVKYQEPALLLKNDGKGLFSDLGEKAGVAFKKDYVARGLAVGDWNNDGRVDAVFTRLNAAPVLLRNDGGQEHSWIGLELEGVSSNRDAIGAKITVEVAGSKLVRWITGGSSYLSSHDKRVVVGLGKIAAASGVQVEIRWPSGNVSRPANVRLDRYNHLLEPRQTSRRGAF
jgi:hypothetical protein